jgi:hypothetical protein
MSELGTGPRRSAWLDWEWRAALITIIGVAVVVAAVFGYFAYRRVQLRHEQEARVALYRQQQLAAVKMAAGVCQFSIQTSQRLGILPQYAKLVRPLPLATRMPHRFVCIGGTNVGHYNMVVDLACKKRDGALCKSLGVALVAILQDDGTVLYRKP